MNEWRNLSVSLSLVEKGGALLVWNLSGRCRLEARVEPCRPGQAGPHHGCKEIPGLRNSSRLKTGSWTQTKEGRWVSTVSSTLSSPNKVLYVCIYYTTRKISSENMSANIQDYAVLIVQLSSACSENIAF